MMKGPWSFGISRTVSALLAVGMGMCASLASADAVLSVESSAASSSAGIKGFEMGVETEGGSAVLFCQVVGKRSVAGSLSITNDGETKRVIVEAASGGDPLEVTFSGKAAFTVKRNGVVIASVIEGPPNPDGSGIPVGGLPSGFLAVRNDPTWQVLMHAVDDSKLLAALTAQAPTTTSPCNQACRIAWPTPDDCLGMWDSYYCCVVQANYDFCSRYCVCDGMASPAAEACKVLASAVFVVEELKCAKEMISIAD